MKYEVENLYQKHGRYDVICDWFKFMAYSIKNALSVKHLGGYEKREQDYISTMAKYTQEEQKCFVNAFNQLVEVMENDVKNGVFKDWLGNFYMNAGIRDKDKQQEFTPYHLGALMAELNISQKWEENKDKDIIAINDPCCGGGCLPIAFCEALKKRSFDYQRNALFVCNDNDQKCVFMTYIQLSLIGAPARILWQDTLTQKVYDEPYDTPALCAQWLKFRKKLEGLDCLYTEPKKEVSNNALQ